MKLGNRNIHGRSEPYPPLGAAKEREREREREREKMQEKPKTHHHDVLTLI